VERIELDCPNCKKIVDKSPDMLDARVERCAGPDDICHDDGMHILKELWYCPWCESYFQCIYELKEVYALAKID
jgi:hypothetical protein